jgi:hypothetical protein
VDRSDCLPKISQSTVLAISRHDRIDPRRLAERHMGVARLVRPRSVNREVPENVPHLPGPEEARLRKNWPASSRRWRPLRIQLGHRRPRSGPVARPHRRRQVADHDAQLPRVQPTVHSAGARVEAAAEAEGRGPRQLLPGRVAPRRLAAGTGHRPRHRPLVAHPGRPLGLAQRRPGCPGHCSVGTPIADFVAVDRRLPPGARRGPGHRPRDSPVLPYRRGHRCPPRRGHRFALVRPGGRHVAHHPVGCHGRPGETAGGEGHENGSRPADQPRLRHRHARRAPQADGGPGEAGRHEAGERRLRVSDSLDGAEPWAARPGVARLLSHQNHARSRGQATTSATCTPPSSCPAMAAPRTPSTSPPSPADWARTRPSRCAYADYVPAADRKAAETMGRLLMPRESQF